MNTTSGIRHCIDSQHWERRDLEKLFFIASQIRELYTDNPKVLLEQLRGKVMTTLFYEPSTRTRLSFESAMLRMGGSVISTENAREFSSAMKGESLEDTIRVIGAYCDVIVLRHYESGSSARAAQVSSVPIINAGDGTGQHPTQSLLDLFTIHEELGFIDDITIAMVGDLLNGRTVRSLCYLLAKNYRVKHIYLVSPPSLRIGRDILSYLVQKNVSFKETDEMDECLGVCDVVYQTRIQKERFADRLREYEAVQGMYVMDTNTLGIMKNTSVLMHPLPRLDEIHPCVDSNPRAAYFRQAANGLYVRMALLQSIFLV